MCLNTLAAVTHNVNNWAEEKMLVTFFFGSTETFNSKSFDLIY